MGNQQENKIWEKAEVILQILSSLCKNITLQDYKYKQNTTTGLLSGK